jgi:large subunit ribosomal protein L9
MEIILLERVEKLGNIGDVVTVKDGYARNFLLPNKKALRSNDSNRKVFEANKERIVSENAMKRAEAEGSSANVDGKEVVLIRAASNAGQLYGSVSVRDITDALNEIGVKEVEKSMVVLERPIKTLGIFDVKVRLHPEVVVTVKANVARSPEEAELQTKGVDVLKQMFDDEAAEDAEAAAELEEEFFEAQAEAAAADEASEA